MNWGEWLWMFVQLNFWIAVVWMVFGLISWLSDRWENKT